MMMMPIYTEMQWNSN